MYIHRRIQLPTREDKLKINKTLRETIITDRENKKTQTKKINHKTREPQTRSGRTNRVAQKISLRI